MTPPNGKQNGTLYEQVLDFARREIEDASSKIEELRRSLNLLEARVEAAKSVYEAVAARLNLEDELEGEAMRDLPAYAEVPLPAPEPPEEVVLEEDKVISEVPSSVRRAASLPGDAPSARQPVSRSKSAAEGSGGNGISDGFAMDLIRRHLDAKETASRKAEQTPPRPVPMPSPVQAKVEQPTEGYPGLSETDRALISEYLRSKREKS